MLTGQVLIVFFFNDTATTEIYTLSLHDALPICPGSNDPETLEKLKERGVDFFRINLSHTEEEDIDKKIKELMGYGIPIILDTEGSQVRSGNTEEIFF